MEKNKLQNIRSDKAIQKRLLEQKMLALHKEKILKDQKFFISISPFIRFGLFFFTGLIFAKAYLDNNYSKKQNIFNIIWLKLLDLEMIED